MGRQNNLCNFDLNSKKNFFQMVKKNFFEKKSNCKSYFEVPFTLSRQLGAKFINSFKMIY